MDVGFRFRVADSGWKVPPQSGREANRDFSRLSRAPQKQAHPGHTRREKCSTPSESATDSPVLIVAMAIPSGIVP